MLSVRSLQHCLPARALLPMQLDKVMHDLLPHKAMFPQSRCMRVCVWGWLPPLMSPRRRAVATQMCHTPRHMACPSLFVRGGGGVGTRPWWLALLACGGVYWPLALEPSAMTSRHPHCRGHPHYCGHPYCRRHPPAPGGESRMQLLPMASSPDGLISARNAVITKTPGREVLTTTHNVNVTQGHGCWLTNA